MSTSPHGREVRLGLVVYGGVSLAIYINGVAREFFNAVRGRGVYRLLKYLIDSDIQVDILSGTSAGGINGILLAYALSNQIDFAECAELWRQHGAIGRLLRSPDDALGATSLLDSQGYFLPRVADALRDLRAKRIEHVNPALEEPSAVPEIDLFVTGTNFDGRLSTVTEATGRCVDVKDHRAVFLLKHRAGRKTPFDCTDDTKIEALARLAAITSCFPMAFTPVHVQAASPAEPPAAARTRAPDDWLAEWGQLEGDGYFIDGGVLDNKPFSYTLREIFHRVATRPVDRRLFYVEPDPERFAQASAGRKPRSEPPSVVDTAVSALVAIPGYESIAEDLRSIAERNDKLERYKRLEERLSGAFLALCDAPEAMGPSVRQMHHEVRLIQIRDRVLRGLLGDEQRLDPREQERVRGFVQAFESWEGDGGTTLTRFDVYYRTRRLFDVIYRLGARVDALGAATGGSEAERNARRRADARLRSLWHALNRQLKLLEIAQHVLESLVDNMSLPPAAHVSGAEPAAIWQLVEQAGLAVLSFGPADLPASYRAAEVPEAVETWLTQDELERLYDALRARLDAQRLGNAPPPAPETRNLLEVADAWTEILLERFLDPGDDLLRAYAHFDVHDAHFFPIEYFAGLGEKDPIEVVRVSPIDADRAFCKRELAAKVTGETLGHFGAFFKRSWRSNDILWGRLDGSCRLLDALLTEAAIVRATSDRDRRARLRQLVSQGPLQPEKLFPSVGGRSQERCRAWLLRLCDDDDATRAAAAAAEDEREHLLACAQLGILCEDLPQVFEDSAREQLEWNEFRLPPASDGSGAAPSFQPKGMYFSSGRGDFDGLAAVLAGKVVAKRAFDELVGGDASQGDGPGRTPVGAYFMQGYRVGEESLKADVPPFVLLELMSKALLVLRNCLLRAFPAQADVVRSSLVFKLLVDYPLRAAYSFAYLGRRSAGAAQMLAGVALGYSLVALFVAATAPSVIYGDDGLHRVAFLTLVVIPLVLLGPGGRILWLRSRWASWWRVGIVVVLSLIGLAATLLLAVTFVVAWPTIRQLLADQLVASLGVSDQSGRRLAGVGIGLLVAAAVVGPWLVRVAVSFSWRSLRDWVAARVAALRSPAT